TEQGNAVTQQLAEILEVSDTMSRDVSAAIRAVQDYTSSKRESDLAPFVAARADVPLQATRFTTGLHGIPALEQRGMTYAKRTVQVMDVLAEFLNAYKRGGMPAARKVAARPATRRLGPALQNAKIAFDQVAQPRALEQLAASSASQRSLEWGIAAS